MVVGDGKIGANTYFYSLQRICFFVLNEGQGL